MKHRCLDGRSCAHCAAFPGHRRARYLVQAQDERRIFVFDSKTSHFEPFGKAE